MFGAARGKSVPMSSRGEERAGLLKPAWSRLAWMF
jgi:hypothetical protein